MLHILSIVLPVFGLIAIGYGARRGKLVLDRTGDGLSDYVFTIAVPALIFKTLTAADLPQSQPWGYWLSYFMGAAIVWAVAMFIGKRAFGLGRMDNVVTGFSSAQANTVMVGIPLILEAYGKPGAVPLFLLVAVHLPIMMTVATIMAEKGDAHWRRIARQLLLHPILLAIFLVPRSASRVYRFQLASRLSSICWAHPLSRAPSSPWASLFTAMALARVLNSQPRSPR
jgi:predicted permease